MKLKYRSETATAGFATRTHDADNFNALYINDETTDANDGYCWKQMASGAWSANLQTASYPEDQSWHDLKLTKVGSTFSLYDNGIQKITGTENALVDSNFALWNYNKSAIFDQVKIRKYTATEPAVTVLAEPASLSFTVDGVASGETHNGITTSIGTQYDEINFGNLQMNDPKFAAQKLTVSTTAANGYRVYVKIDGYLQGLMPANKIDPFAALNASWTAPQVWSSPTGTENNSDSGWVGANTSDMRVVGWASASGKFGPLSSTNHVVMQSSSSDDVGTSIYVSYGIEVNGYQPADRYMGQIIYSIVPTY
jgi:hypothetical protein